MAQIQYPCTAVSPRVNLVCLWPQHLGASWRSDSVTMECCGVPAAAEELRTQHSPWRSFCRAPQALQEWSDLSSRQDLSARIHRREMESHQFSGMFLIKSNLMCIQEPACNAQMCWVAVCFWLPVTRACNKIPAPPFHQVVYLSCVRVVLVQQWMDSSCCAQAARGAKPSGHLWAGKEVGCTEALTLEQFKSRRVMQGVCLSCKQWTVCKKGSFIQRWGCGKWETTN